METGNELARPAAIGMAARNQPDSPSVLDAHLGRLANGRADLHSLASRLESFCDRLGCPHVPQEAVEAPADRKTDAGFITALEAHHDDQSAIAARIAYSLRRLENTI